MPSLPEEPEPDTAGHVWAPFTQLELQLPRHRQPQEARHIFSWNLNGVRARIKKDKFLSVLRGKDADVLCLQEVRWSIQSFLSKPGVREALREMRYSHIAYHESSSNIGYAGVAIFSRVPFLSFGEGVNDPELDTEGRVCWAEFEKFRLFNVYGPNSGSPGNLKTLPKKLRFQKSLDTLLYSFQDKPSLMCGDFNVVRRESDVWSGLSDTEWVDHPACAPQERDALREMLDHHNLVDVQAHLGVQDFTFFRAKYLHSSNKGMRLDYFFCDAALMRLVSSSEVHRNMYGSDHRGISLYLSAPAFPELQSEQASVNAFFKSPDLATAYSRRPEFVGADTAQDLRHLDSPQHYAYLLSSVDQEFFNNENEPPRRPHPLDSGRSGKISLQDMEEYLNGEAEHFIEDSYTERREQLHSVSSSDPIVPLVRLRIGGSKGAIDSLVDSGATACIADYGELVRHMGKEEVDSRLFTGGYMPSFRTADGNVAKPMGSISLQFSLSGTPFLWDFYVIEKGAYPIILGNDFLSEAKTSILYAQERLEFYSPLTGAHVSVPFDTRQKARGSHRAAALLSEEDFVLPPLHCRRVEVYVEKVSGFRSRTSIFGHVSPCLTPGSPTVVPGNDALCSGRTEVLVANLSPDRHLRILPGERVASFLEGDVAELEEEYDTYVCDLTKLGEDDFFVDWEQLYPDATFSESKPTHSLVQHQSDSTVPSPLEGAAATQGASRPTVARASVLPEPDGHAIEQNENVIEPPACHTESPRCGSEASFPSPARRPVGGKDSLALSSGSGAKTRRNFRPGESPEGVTQDREGASVGRDAGPGLSASSPSTARGSERESAPPSVLSSCLECVGAEGNGACAQVLAGLRRGSDPPAGQESSVSDKFSPFSADDVPLVHMPRFTKAQVDAMTADEVESHFTSGPLSLLCLGKSLTPAQLLSLKICLLRNRDMFALNDKSPGLVNKGGVRVDTGDAPPQVYPSRPVMPHMRPLIQKHIDEMLKYGIIEHSTSPWGAAVLMVPKKVPPGHEGDVPMRFCLDYRLVNKYVKKDAYGLPRINDALSSFAGSKFFTTLDACSGYWQVPMASEADREKLAFRTFCGHYQPTRMPFGLVTAPAYYQRFMDMALQGLSYNCCLVFIDDVIVFSATFEQHLKDLTAVFSALRKVGIHLKAKKSTVASTEVDYLGHLVTSEGIRPSPDKLITIERFNPESREELRAFCGLTGYYRRFIHKYADVVRPLTAFVNSKLPWKGLTPAMKEAVRTY